MQKVSEKIDIIKHALTNLAQKWNIEFNSMLIQYSNGNYPAVTILLDVSIFERLKWYRNWMKNKKNDLTFWVLAKECGITMSFFRGRISLRGSSLNNQFIVIKDFLEEIAKQPEDIWNLR